MKLFLLNRKIQQTETGFSQSDIDELLGSIAALETPVLQTEECPRRKKQGKNLSDLGGIAVQDRIDSLLSSFSSETGKQKETASLNKGDSDAFFQDDIYSSLETYQNRGTRTQPEPQKFQGLLYRTILTALLGNIPKTGK